MRRRCSRGRLGRSGRFIMRRRRGLFPGFFNRVVGSPNVNEC